MKVQVVLAVALFLQGCQVEERLLVTTDADLSAWRTSKEVGTAKEDPVLHPGKITAAIRPCAGTEPAFSRCVAARDKALQIFTAPHAQPENPIEIALCFVSGCDGSVFSSLANACMWAGFFARSTPTQAKASELATRICGKAEFGGDDRRGRIREAWLAALTRARAF